MSESTKDYIIIAAVTTFFLVLMITTICVGVYFLDDAKRFEIDGQVYELKNGEVFKLIKERK